MTPRRIHLAAFLMLLVMAAAHGDTYHNKPDPAATGGLLGRIVSRERLQAVIVIEPFELKAYQANIDSGAGRFELKGLPVGEYDLLVKTIGHVYEGLTLEWDPDLSPTPVELSAICGGVMETFKTSEDYFNRKRIVRLTGDPERARLFVCQTRTKHVVAPSGAKIDAHIRRLDLVEMIRTRHTWQLVTTRHLLRQEVPLGSDDATVRFIASPRLGAILVGDRMTDVGTIDLSRLPRMPANRYASAEHESQ